MPFDQAAEFTTTTGKIEFYSEKLKSLGQELPLYFEPKESAHGDMANRFPLTLLTTHSRFRVHSTLANVDSLANLDPEPLIEINNCYRFSGLILEI